jgi:hypothetical protein
MFRKLDSTTPENALTPPKIELSTEYRDKFELIVFAAAAGVTTRKPTRRVPVILIPTATAIETSRRYRRFILATLTPLEIASSSEIIPRTIPL